MASRKLFALLIVSLLLFTLLSGCTDSTGEAFKLLRDERIKPIPVIKTDFIPLSVAVSPLKIEKNPQGFDSLQIPETNLIGKPGEPLIPVITKRILLPQGHEIDSIELIKSGKQVFTNVNIEPAQQPIPLLYKTVVDDVLYSVNPSKPLSFELTLPSSVIESIKEKFGGEIPQYLLDEKGELKAEFFQRTPPNQKIYESLGSFPEKDYEIVSVQEFKGYKILVLNIFPVKYFPKDKRIEYYPNISFNVKTKEIPGFEVPRSFRVLPVDEVEVQNKVDDSRKLSTYKKPRLAKEEPVIQRMQSDYKYVIITTEEFASHFQPLTDWKALRPENPITATIVSIESILSNSNYDCNSAYMNSLNPVYGDEHCSAAGHNDDAAKIRNFIRGAFVNWNTEYVLLGGDADGVDFGEESGGNVLPVRLLFDSWQSSSQGIPSDLYYGCLDGSFDRDGNGVFGETTDGINEENVDLYAEVFVGRAPVDSVEEVQHFVLKTIAYEQSDSDYLKKSLMVGEYLGFGGPAQYASDSLEEVRWGSCNHSYCTSGIGEKYLTDSLYDSESRDWSKYELIDKMNEGVHFINHLGHASTLYDMKLCHAPFESPGVYCGTSGDRDLNLLNNSDYFLVYSQGCYPAAFDNWNYSGVFAASDSIAEHFVLDEKGAFAFIGNSRYGWGKRNSTDGASNRFHRQFADAIITENTRNLAKANQVSKEENLWDISNWAIRFVYYELNLLGDPETPLKQPLFPEPIAGISSPLPTQTVDGVIDINGFALQGTSSEATFSHYTIEWGIGSKEDVNEWFTEGITLADNGLQPVSGAQQLGSFDSLSAPDGTITIKLEAFDLDGKFTASYVPVKVNNVEMFYPFNLDSFRLGEEIEIKGKIEGHHVTDYSIEWRGCGLISRESSDEGISLMQEGETIGLWDTSPTGLLENPFKHFCYLKLTVNYDVYQPVSEPEEEKTIYLDKDLKEGWPVRIPYEVCEDPFFGWVYFWSGLLPASVADLEGDGDKELVFYIGGCPPKLKIYNSDGSEFGSWSVGSEFEEWPGGNLHKPLIADIDKDGKDEILVVSFGEVDPNSGQISLPKLHAFNSNGLEPQNWPVELPSGFNATLVSADLDFDGSLEVIMQDHSLIGKIIIVKANGTILSQCELEENHWGAFLESTPAVGNFDSDPELEIVAVEPGINAGYNWDTGKWVNEGKVFVINSDCSILPGWPKTIPGQPFSSPVVADLDNDGSQDTIIGLLYVSNEYPDLDLGGLYAFDSKGKLLSGWPFLKGKEFWSTPSLHDFDGDGFLEIVASRLGFVTYLLNHTGSIVSGWPQYTGWNDYYSSIIANIDSDSEPEILTTAGNGYNGDGVYAWNFNGSMVEGFPKYTEVDAQAPALVSDLDNDGKTDLVASSDWDQEWAGLKERASIYVWELDSEFDPLKNPWPQFHHDAQHTGLYAKQCNEVLNPGFEFDKGINYLKNWTRDDEIAFNGIPDGWRAGGTNVDFSLDSINKIGGVKSMKMDLDDARAWVAQQIPIEYGKTYRVSGWIKTNLSTGFGIISSHCLNENRGLMGPDCGLDDFNESRREYGASDWKYQEFTVTADTPQAAFLQVQCYASPNGTNSNPATGNIWCDDFKVIEIEKESYKTTQCGKHCVDGTPSGQCLKDYGTPSTPEKYCYNGKILKNCQKCGCNSRKQCTASGNCIEIEGRIPTME